MKKLILVLVSILMVNLAIGQFTFGPAIGWNSSKISTNLGDNFENFKAAAVNSKLMTGMFLRIGKKVYLQPEIFISSKGGIFNYDVKPIQDNTAQHVSQQAAFKTIDVPLLLGNKILNLKGFKFRVFMGPVASIITDKIINLNLGADNEPLLNKDDFKNIIWGGQVGAGIDLLRFTIDVKYELGLNDISNSVNLSQTKSNLFFITLGFKIL